MTENKTAKTPTDDGHVAHVYLFDKTGRPMVAWDNAKDIKLGDKLYAAPKREWIGLTDEEIQDLSYLSQKIDASNSEWFDRWGFSRAIEAKLREKNHG
jgi:hypothetical protein